MNVIRTHGTVGTSGAGSRLRKALCFTPVSRSLAVALALVAVMAVESLVSAAPPDRKRGRVYEADEPGARQIGPGSKARAPAPALKPGDPRPAVVVEEPVHDFGRVWVGPMLKHTFRMKNEGTDTLKITRVKPSCGCTIAGPYPRTIEPGKTGEFPFSVKSQKLRGKFEKAITVNTNDPAMPTVRLRLRGTVKRYVEYTPTNIHFGKMVGGAPLKRVIKLTNGTEKPMELQLGAPPQGNFELKLVETTPGQAYELHVTANPPFEPGVFAKKIIITTNVPQQERIQIDLRGTAPERLDLSPKVLTVRPNPNATQATTRVVRFTNYGSKPVKLLEATVDDPAITATIKEQQRGKAYSIQIQIPANHTFPPNGRRLTLKTDDAQKPLLSVHIRSRGARVAKRAKPRTTTRPAEKMVGQPVPAYTLKTLEGKGAGSSTLLNKITVLDFFAVNCGFCKKQIPRLEKVRQEYEGKGVRFLAISQTMRARTFTDAQVMDKIKQLGFRGEVATDPNNIVGPLFKVTSFPTAVVIGKDRVVAAVSIGNRADLETRLKGQLDTLLAGKPIRSRPALAKGSTAPTAIPAPKPAATKRVRATDLIGKPAPRFSIKTLDGKDVSNAGFAKHPATVLDFVAGNCGYCGKQIPRLEKIRQTYQQKGVRFVNVFETMRTPWTQEQVIDKMKSLGAHMEIAHDSANKIGPLFGASGFPTMVVIGKSGKVEAVNVGNIGDLEKRVTGQLDALIAGRPVPKVAAAPARPARKRPTDLIGKPAPKFAIKTFDGKDVSNAEFAKHPATVLDFVAGNCGYCGKQIPRLEKIRQTYQQKGVRFVNVFETMRTPWTQEQVIDKMKSLGAHMEIAHDSANKIGPLFGASGFPTMVVIGKSGKVEAVNVGNIGDLEKRVTGQLDALIAGRPVPKVAAAPARPARKRATDTIGKPAPKFAIKTLDGKDVGNAEFAKHPATVLDFVAANCGYCGKQIPRVEKLRQTYQQKGVRFVTVFETMRKPFTKEQVIDKMKSLGASSMEVAHDVANKVGPLFGASGFPTMVVVGKSGKVEAVNVGNIADLEKRLSGQLDALIAGRPVPRVATAPARPRQRPAEGMVGKPVPSFALKTLEGKSISSEELRSYSATVLNFVAPNCGFCKRALPNVEKVRKDYATKGVRFVNVVQKMRKDYTTEQIVDVMKKAGSNLEITTDDFAGNALGRQFKATSYPTMFVIGKDGKIANVNIGAKANLEALLRGQLDALIK